MLSFPSLIILVPLWSKIIYVVFFYFSKLLFSVFLLMVVLYVTKITQIPCPLCSFNVYFHTRFRYQRVEKVGHLWSWPMPAEKTLLLSYRNKADDIWRHKVGVFGAFELNKSECILLSSPLSFFTLGYPLSFTDRSNYRIPHYIECVTEKDWLRGTRK